MKKFMVFAAAAAFALCACEQDNPQVDGSGTNQGDEQQKPVTGVVLNELSGADKYIELYNITDQAVSLEGFYLVKYDAGKEGGKSTTWTGAAGMTIAAKGFVVLESSDLSDPNEDGDPNYAYESQNHVFKGGLSGKKNVFIELYNASDEKLSEFKRGEEGSAGWNEVGGFNNDKKHTFSRVPDGTGEFVYADPTKGQPNAAKYADIEQEPAE